MNVHRIWSAVSGWFSLRVARQEAGHRWPTQTPLAATHQQALSEALKLRTMMEGMAEGIVVADAQDVITEVNRWFLEKAGLSREQVVGRSLWDLHPSTAGTARVRDMIDEFRKGARREVYSVQRPLLGMHLSLRVQPIFEGDVYRGIILNAIDVSDLVKSRQAAEAATQAKSQFLANMSHEIRTPMTAILGFTDILLENLDEPQAIEAAQTVKRSGEHLLRLINDILDISKIEAGKLGLEMTRWSPRQVVADVVSLMHVRAKAKGLTLTTRLDGVLPETILTDPARLRQILVNLVGNAIKFTEVGGVHIGVRMFRMAGDHAVLCIAVADTGPGIPDSQIEGLFAPFTQADGSASRQHEGTGLGLTISRQLARALGGDVTAGSELGKGSVFTLVVPTGSLEGVALTSSPLDVHGADRDFDKPACKLGPRIPCRILLAEDIPDNQRMIEAVLRGAGASVTFAENGQEALEMALAAQAGWGRRYDDPKAPFDVVLMDMQMPVLDGYEATRRLRQEGYSGLVIALTAHALQGDRDKCLAAGCDDYLSKPIDRRELVEVVARWLASRGKTTQETTASPDDDHAGACATGGLSASAEDAAGTGWQAGTGRRLVRGTRRSKMDETPACPDEGRTNAQPATDLTCLCEDTDYDQDIGG